MNTIEYLIAAKDLDHEEAATHLLQQLRNSVLNLTALGETPEILLVRISTHKAAE